jgi:hypothetical protein
MIEEAIRRLTAARRSTRTLPPSLHRLNTFAAWIGGQRGLMTERIEQRESRIEA